MLAHDLAAYRPGPDWSATLSSLDRFLAAQPAARLVRLNPLAVAHALGLDDDLVTDAFLAGTLEGWFDLRWDYHCPHCEGVTTFSSHLGAARAEGFCAACHVGFRNELDQNVEVTFSAAPRLAALVPKDQAPPNPSGDETVPPVPRLSGLRLLHRPLFHERFSDDILSAEESLEIRHVVFLFTDIKGSTQLYEDLGDAKAYNLVRDHFRVLFTAVESHGGVVVKTIGDAVMASFRRAGDALNAALEVHDTIGRVKIPGTEESVVVKMGLHGGSAIAVTMNERFDYFGQTVNKAARIQGLAKNQEVYFSDVIFRDADCRRALSRRKAAVRRWTTELKGIGGDQVVYSVGDARSGARTSASPPVE